MKKISFLLFFALSISCANKEIAIPEGYASGSEFCTASGGNSLQLLLTENAIPEEVLRFPIQIIWISNQKDFQINTVKKNLNSTIHNLNTTLNTSHIAFNFSPEIKVVYDKKLTLEKLYRNDLAEYCISKYGSNEKINLFIIESEGILNGYTPVLTERFDRYKNKKGYNSVFIGNKAVFNKTTLAHEIGHFFGLQHTFGKEVTPFSTDEIPTGTNCFSSGDWLCDTPADPNMPIKSCNQNLEKSNFKPLFNNYMSYYPNVCKNAFTKEQSIIMHRFAYTYRNHLIQK